MSRSLSIRDTASVLRHRRKLRPEIIAQRGDCRPDCDVGDSIAQRTAMRDLHFRADDAALEDELAVHDAVHGAVDAVVAFPDLLTEQVQPAAGGDLLAELAFLRRRRSR